MNASIRKTNSLCPECRRRIPAILKEDHGAVYMEKTCPDHGTSRTLIAKHAGYYRDLMGLYDRLSRHFPYHRDRVESTAFSTTLDCNMKCPICFAGDEQRTPQQDLDIDSIRQRLETIRGRGINFKLTGGEPTLRDDLPELIRMVRESGNYPVLVTNGIKLADRDYLRHLRDAGLAALAPWFDAVGDDTIYARMRGRPLSEQRASLLENAAQLGIRLIIFFVCVKGVNEEQLPEIMAMTRKYPGLLKIIVMGYMHRGSRGFSDANEYTTDELWEVIVRSSDVFRSLDDLVVAIKLNLISRAVRHIYHCYNSQTVLMPRSDRPEDGFAFDRWRDILAHFDTLLDEQPQQACRYFLRHFVPDLLKKGFLRPLTQRLVLKKRDLGDTFLPPAYYWLQFQHLYYPRNYDETMVRNFCPYPSFNPGLEPRISFCEYYNLRLHT